MTPGDVHALLVNDHGIAKSTFLRQAEKLHDEQGIKGGGVDE